MGTLLRKILYSTLVLVPNAVFAQTEYKFLETGIFGTGDSIDLAQTGQFELFITSAYTIFLTTCIVIAVIMIVIHGLEYMLSDVPMVKVKNKQRMGAAITGLIIALTAWIFLYTLNPRLVDINLELGQILINNSVSSVGTTPNGGGGNTTSPGGDNSNPDRPGGGNADRDRFAPGLGQGIYGAVPRNEFEVRQQLKASGKISINDESSCSPNSLSGCRTYVGGLQPNQIQGLLKLQNDCNCSFVISGAAEQGGGHSNGSRHYTGHAVDLRTPNSTLETYICQNKPGKCNNNYDPSIFNWVNDERSGEQPHLHVEFK